MGQPLFKTFWDFFPPPDGITLSQSTILGTRYWKQQGATSGAFWKESSCNPIDEAEYQNQHGFDENCKKGQLKFVFDKCRSE